MDKEKFMEEFNAAWSMFLQYYFKREIRGSRIILERENMTIVIDLKKRSIDVRVGRRPLILFYFKSVEYNGDELIFYANENYCGPNLRMVYTGIFYIGCAPGCIITIPYSISG
mgnify:CR=1 FL=1